MLLNIILSDFQQYRTFLAKVIQFFVSPEKCENQRYKVLTLDRRYELLTSSQSSDEISLLIQFIVWVKNSVDPDQQATDEAT